MNTQRLAVGLVLVLVIPACGGGSSSSTSVTTTTTLPCEQSVVFDDNGPVPARTVVAVPFTLNATARIDIVVDWTSPSSPIGVYAVQGACDLEHFNARTCHFVAQSEPSTVKPRRLSTATVGSGEYAVYLANFAEQDESMALQIFSRSASCPALAGAPVSAQGRGTAPTVERMIGR